MRFSSLLLTKGRGVPELVMERHGLGQAVGRQRVQGAGLQQTSVWWGICGHAAVVCVALVQPETLSPLTSSALC